MSDNNKWLVALATTSALSLTGILALQVAKSLKVLATDTEQIIAKRRTIQPDDYDLTRPVPKSIVQRILEAGNWAPTHGKTEPWRFVVFSGTNALKELGDLDASLYKAQTPSKQFKEKRYLKKMRCKLRSSYVIAVCMERQKSEQIPFEEETMAVACAVQNMLLAATALGVGMYWHSGPNINSKEMREYLGMNNEKDQCYGFLTVGYSSKPHPTRTPRPVSEKTTWVHK